MLRVFMVASGFGIRCHGVRWTERARIDRRVCPATGTRSRGGDTFGESQRSGASGVVGYRRVRRCFSASAEQVPSGSIVMRRCMAKAPLLIAWTPSRRTNIALPSPLHGKRLTAIKLQGPACLRGRGSVLALKQLCPVASTVGLGITCGAWRADQ